MTLFLPATAAALDSNGRAVSGATWNFYYKGTLTPASTSEGTQVAADSDGVFDEITLTGNISYRAALKTSAGRTLFDIGSVVDQFFAPASKPAVDSGGLISSGAVWKFYTTETTTPQPVYSDETLTVKLGSEVRANAAGRFPPIYLDDAITYRAILDDADGTELADIDPVTTNTMAAFLNPATVLTIEPSGDWNGTAASGFSSTPTDPTRTTAKPAMRLIVPQNQAFTDELLVGVYAGANDSGSLLNTMGLQKVTAHYEGTSVDITTPTFQTFDDVNGNPVTYYGWWIKLKHNATHGVANLYFEAVPRDTSMQNRVIGPYAFLPSATLYDYDVALAPSQAIVAGSSYQTLAGALTYLKGVSAQRPRIRFTEGGTYILTASELVAGGYNSNAGWCTIEATVPTTIGNNSGTKGQVRLKFGRLRFKGANLTLDMRYIQEFRPDGPADDYYWFDGCSIINSAGPNELWDKGQRPYQGVSRNVPIFTEVTYDALRDGGGEAQLVRGGTWDRIVNDAFAAVSCVIGATVTNMGSEWWKTEVPAITFQYTGGSATATMQIAGKNGAAKTWTARENGVTVGTFSVPITSGSAGYNVSEVTAWINSLSGWTATTLDDTRAAKQVGPAGTVGTSGGPLAETDAKTAPLTMIAIFDLHVDWWIKNQGTTPENVVIADNLVTDAQTTNFFIGQQTDLSVPADFLFINNAFVNAEGYAEDKLTQFTDDLSHVVFVHNTMGRQRINLGGFDDNGYSLFANNATRGLTDPTVPAAFKNNHLDAETAYSGGTGNTVGGSSATNYADIDAHDLTPAGDLLANLKVPVVAYDINRVARGATAPAGALA